MIKKDTKLWLTIMLIRCLDALSVDVPEFNKYYEDIFFKINENKCHKLNEMLEDYTKTLKKELK